ncbi:conserved unknown protein [Ectocarpus siliculosus]|uniref:NADP-dependent oxidoreductase domain-containing protein n=1 Tax=Ectocarpus siliculosus TaxID=2880 RepID=D7FYC6_ECTSI|nr:conserved unknown protein [Ectocarpus siliculosus]|eukprot:CBJ32468.1 conserved unknown protein [Ectocarpus siliculosus]
MVSTGESVEQSAPPAAATPAGGKSASIPAVLGTMSIPEPLDTAAAREALEYFHAAGFDEIDTAILYQGGATETTLGEIGVEKFRVAAKANPWYKTDESHDFFTPTYGLRPDLVKEQLRKSIEVLGVPSVELFYLHAPDRNTPIEGTLQAVHELRSEGLFREWGLSNYTAWETVDIWHICKAKGWQPPAVYQGMYNAVTREVERELLPALKKLGMRFYAYNPLAGGMLSGKHKFEKPPEDGRFSTTSLWGSLYRARYWRKELFDEIETLKAICVKHDTDLVSASFRWMRHHSSLTGESGDTVIICGSSVSQVKGNVDACRDENPLPKDLVDGFDAAWQSAKPHCPSYFK